MSHKNRSLYNATDPSAIVYGVHPVHHVILAKKRKIYTAFFTEASKGSLKNMLKMLPEYTKKVVVDRAALTEMSNSEDHQGIVVITEPFHFRKAPFSPQRHPMLVLLDRVQNPRNLGAIIRSAFCAGMSGIGITQKNSSPFSSAVMKAAAGLSEYLDIALLSSLPHFLSEREKEGYTIYLTGFSGTSLYTTDFKKPYCLVFGNEEEGVEKSLFTPTRRVITIPQKSEVLASYNVAVAAGIVMAYSNRFMESSCK